MPLILGIDPGSLKTGFGIIEHEGSRSTYVTSGIIRLPKAPLPERLKVIFDSVTEIVEEYSPRELSIEEVFMARDPKAAIKLGQARGAAIVAASSRDASLHEYSPNEIKQAITGRGHAEKQQIQHMVKILLGLTKSPATDAADALAVAICHGNIRESKARLAKARQSAGFIS